MGGVVLVDVGDRRFEIGAQPRVGNCRARSGVRWETARGRDKGQAKVRSFPYVHRHARSKSDHCSRENVGGGPAARSGLRRPVLRRGQDHRRLLPAELQVASGETRERPLLFDRRSGGAGGISRLQALPPRPARRDGPAGRGGAARLRADRVGRGSALARRPRRGSGAEPLPLPSRVQEGDRRDAQGLCGRGAGAARGREPPDRRDRHRGDLRRRLQLFEPLLRDRDGAARHDADRGAARRPRRRHPLRRRRGLARLRARRRHRQGRLRHHARRRTGRARARIAGPLPAGETRRAATKISSTRSRRSSASSRRPAKTSTCRSTSAAPPFSRRSGRRCAPSRRARRRPTPKSRKRVGQPKAVRAVAQACGANPLAVAIPCHRVVRTDGGLSGYRWGVERKRKLLDREVA